MAGIFFDASISANFGMRSWLCEGGSLLVMAVARAEARCFLRSPVEGWAPWLQIAAPRFAMRQLDRRRLSQGVVYLGNAIGVPHEFGYLSI